MSRQRKTVIQMLTLILLMGITFYLLFRGQNINLILKSAMSVDKRYLLLAAASMLFYIFCGGWCIRVLFHGLGQSMSIWRCFKYSFVEFFFSAITPSSTGGQPMQLIYMKQDGYKLSDSSVILLVVTALYKVSFLVITLVLFVFNFHFIAHKVFTVRFLFGLGLTMNIVLIIVLCILIFSKRLILVLSKWGLKLLGKLRFLKHTEKRISSLEEQIEKYHECANFMKSHPFVIFRTFLVLTLQRLAIYIVPYLIYRSFGMNSYSAIKILCLQLLLSMCVEMLPLPGAVGISEKVFLILFLPVFGEHFLYSAVLLSRGISFYLLVFFAGILINGLQLYHIVYNKRKQKQTTSSGGTT